MGPKAPPRIKPRRPQRKKPPEEEAESHGLFAADMVHKEAAEYAAGEVEAVKHGLMVVAK